MNKILNYLKASRAELAKVVWPSRRELVNHTLEVIGISVAVALFLAVLDFIFSKLLALFL